MFLSKIKIQGFKSFPDKTEITFSDGVTSIVGPNGSGKTNIVDAIRWVLGEQKSTALRSNKMEEVIFNGTKKMKPINVCEVVLTIENNKMLLPIEYETVEIGRRYFRNGESEYYINKTQCRLKDIHDLFVDTGMSSGAYSVIELKMVESILSKNPSDRRVMIDEAAGINNYSKRKAASTRKLVATKSDMERVSDIMAEVEGNVKKLKLQMKRYDRHKTLSDELVNCEHLYLSKMLELIDADLKPIELSLEKKKSSKMLSEKELKRREDRLKKIQTKFESTKYKLESIQKKIKKIEEDIVSTNQRLIISTEQITHSKNRIEHFEKEIVVKNEQKVKIDLDIKHLNKDINKLHPKIKKKSIEYDKLTSDYKKNNNKLDETESKRNKIQKILQDNLYKINSHSNAIDTNKKLILENEVVISEYKKDLHANESDYRDIKRLLQKKESELDKEKKIIAENASDIKSYASSLEKLEQDLDHLIKKKNEITSNIISHNNQIDFYKNITLTDSGEANGNDYLINNKKTYKSVLGRVNDLVKTDIKYIAALSISIGAYSDYIIIDKMKEALRIIDRYKSKNMSFNFIVLDQIKKIKNIKTSSRHLISKVEYNKKFSNLFLLLIGRYYIVDDFSNTKNNEYIYVTLNGDIFTGSGIVQINPNTKTSSLFVSHEINLLENDLKKMTSEISTVNNKIKKITNKKNALIERIKNLECVKQDHEESIKKNIIYTEQKKFALNEYYSRARTIKSNISKHDKNIINLKFEINKSKNKQKEYEKKVSKDKIDIELLTKDIQKLKNMLLDLRQEIQRKNIELIEIKNKGDITISRINNYRENSNEISADIVRYTSEINKLNRLIVQLQNSINLSNKTLKKLYLREKNCNKQRNAFEIDYSKEYQKFQSIQIDINELRNIKDDNTEEINKIKVEIERMKAEREFHQKKIDEINRDHIKQETLDKFTLLSSEEILKKIDKIKNSIDKIGPVNMDVDTQHQDEIKRFDFLYNQYNDLIESEKSLKETIVQLDKVARKRFVDTFDKIKDNFFRTYNLFYDKGNATIELKGDDVLDAEILIKATPPGKSTQSLSMLSGGEKAITAIALLLAIYQVKPSPFCILDEVDAPLDDINIIKFNQVIRKFSKNSQFIIVTHNKLTMEASDYLYGVTQQKQGVSSIVSVSLKDVEEFES